MWAIHYVNANYTPGMVVYLLAHTSLGILILVRRRRVLFIRVADGFAQWEVFERVTYNNSLIVQR